jgi:hypothetical protein
VRNAYNISVGKLEGKRPRGISRNVVENNIRMDLMVGGYGLDSSVSGRGTDDRGNELSDS